MSSCNYLRPLTLDFPCNPILVDEWFIPYINLPKSFIHNKITMNINPTWILIHKFVKMSNWEVVMFFCCVGSSCEGVDSNQFLPLQCKLCINIKVAYLERVKYLFYVHVKITFVLTWNVHFNVFTLSDFKEILCIHVLTYSNARWLAYCGFAHLTWEFVDMLTCWVVPIQWITQAFYSFLGTFDWSKVSFWGGGGVKGIFLCIASLNCYKSRTQRVIQPWYLPQSNSSPMFQDPTNNSHFNLKTCTCNVVITNLS